MITIDFITQNSKFKS